VSHEVSSQIDAVADVIQAEKDWRAACLAAARAGGGSGSAVEECRRLSRHPKFGTAEHELIAETERFKDDRDCWVEALIVVRIDKKSRALVDRSPISVAESQRRWPAPVSTPPAPLSLEERISRLEGLARRRGDLPPLPA